MKTLMYWFFLYGNPNIFPDVEPLPLPLEAMNSLTRERDSMLLNLELY